MESIDDKELASNSVKKLLPIIRQVMIVAEALILFGFLGTIFLQPELIWLTVFIDAGLSFAGLSGICFMAKLLAKMPWNS